MPQREIKTYHGAKQSWVPNEFGELKYNPNMGYSGEGFQSFGEGFYQALDPNVALSNYAIPLSKKSNTRGALLENTTNPDLYYYLDRPLKKQSRFIKNAIINELNEPDVNIDTLENIVQDKLREYKTYNLDDLTYKDIYDEMFRVDPNVDPSFAFSKSNEAINNPAIKEIYAPTNENYYFNRAYNNLDKAGKLVGEYNTDLINKEMDRLVLEDILKKNNGEIPQELLKKNSTLYKSLSSSFPSEEEYNTIIDAVTKHGGAGISREGNVDGRIFVSNNPDLVASREIGVSNMEPIVEMIAKGELPKPTINYNKPNLKVEPIKQTDTSLSIPAKSINKQTTVAKAPVNVTPKVTDVPLGARLYEAGLNPTKVAKVLSDPKLLSQASKTLGQIVTNPKTYINLAKGVFTPENIAMVGSDYLMHKADQAVESRLKAKYNIKSQAEFNKLYPTLSTFERGQLGNTYPEMYQSYMKGR